MIIGDIKLSYPCVRYEVEVTHFTSRKSTAIEWIILEAIMKASAMDKYSGMSVDDLFKHIFTISDSDLLIKPCLIQLQDLGAITVRGLNDDVELKDIQMKDLKLTSVGDQMQKQGLLPGEDRTDNITVYYDVLKKTLFENNLNTYKDKATGIAVDNIVDANDVTFPGFDVKQLVLDSQKNSGKKKYQWLQNTTKIKDLSNIGSSLLWKNVVRKIELGRKGLCNIFDSKDDININRLIFSDGVLPSTSNESNLPEIVFDNPDDELKDLFFIDELPSKLNETMRRDNNFLIDSKYYKDEYFSNTRTKSPSVIIVTNAEEYSFEQSGKSIRVKLTENYIPKCCVYFGDVQSLYAGNITLHNAVGYKMIEFGYAPKQREINLAAVIMQIVEEGYDKDARLVMLLSILGASDVMYEYIERALDKISDLHKKADLIESLDKLHFAIFNKKIGIENIAKKVFVQNVLEDKQFNSVSEVKSIISEMSQINIYKNNDAVADAMLKGILERTNSIQDINEVWDIWKTVLTIKRSYLSWINKNGLRENLYSIDAMKSLIVRFADENVFEIGEYTQAERAFLELNRIYNGFCEILPKVDIAKKYSDEAVLEIVVEKKANISEIKDMLRRWRDNIQIIDNRICSVDELLMLKTVFSMFNEKINQLMDATDVFFDESALKYNKVYVIDTCVLMHDSSVLSWFSDGKAMVIVPTVVINELDGIKESDNHEEAADARAAIRTISNYRSYEWLNCKENAHPELLPIDFEKDNKDNMILSVALKYFVKKPILITDDINFRNKADSQNIESMDREAYFNSKQYEHMQSSSKKNKKKKKK